MKFTAHEEYGLRCLLQIGRRGEGGSLTIPEISRAEGLSPAYVAKLLRILRNGGLLQSARGQSGGYMLARPPEQIVVGEVLAELGGRLFNSDFCSKHTGSEQNCTHTVDCSVRALWRTVQLVVDQVLSKTTLKDLLQTETALSTHVTELVKLAEKVGPPPLPTA